jgi:hypothetical protein
MCYRKPQPLWQRLNFIALYLLMASTYFLHRNPWKLIVGGVGAVVLIAGIALMFAGRKRENGSGGFKV